MGGGQQSATSPPGLWRFPGSGVLTLKRRQARQKETTCRRGEFSRGLSHQRRGRTTAPSKHHGRAKGTLYLLRSPGLSSEEEMEALDP
ncbi:hypothetical protein LEMLEM_LOCUS12208 [Lemmus lemmus]